MGFSDPMICNLGPGTVPELLVVVVLKFSHLKFPLVNSFSLASLLEHETEVSQVQSRNADRLDI